MNCRLRTPSGGITSANSSSSVTHFSSFFERRITSWVSFTFIIIQRCSHCGGSASSGCPADPVSGNQSCFTVWDQFSLLINFNFFFSLAFLPAMVNSFIHVLMYSYYGLAALGPAVTKYLWWKKYLTILQLIQFTAALVLGVNGIRSGCDFPLWMQYALVIYMMSFIVLFGNFYAKAYIAKVR